MRLVTLDEMDVLGAKIASQAATGGEIFEITKADALVLFSAIERAHEAKWIVSEMKKVVASMNHKSELNGVEFSASELISFIAGNYYTALARVRGLETRNCELKVVIGRMRQLDAFSAREE